MQVWTEHISGCVWEKWNKTISGMHGHIGGWALLVSHHNSFCACEPISSLRRLSWQPAPRSCPSLPVQSPGRPGLRHLGDRLPIGQAAHLWGWALLQNSSNTWGKNIYYCILLTQEFQLCILWKLIQTLFTIKLFHLKTLISHLSLKPDN